MPKFTEAEKEKIRLDMMHTAHQCFIAKGLKNTSIEEITSSVSIAKSSFYVFFESKEMLYLDLLVSEGEEIERRVWPKVEQEKDVREAIKIYLREMSDALESSILTQRLITNLEEYTVVSRKIDPQYSLTKTLRSIVPLMEFIKKNKELKTIVDEEIEVISGVIRACLAMVIHKKDLGEEIYPKVQEIMFNAVANQLAI
ncbi:TetR/AcrR family transcriptional regulator [Metabacillus fastidiosus]|uniref:TetR/AcrR family transcriptional regulator n=1 Tax=Metabacillus fastidiosus TaxID=1458 RepID=A0ABU6NY11_9BACI|nr:TetR/AcrR family transcriptional regulator [Metabacillus fastidiosus]MED4402005.1 TetR/AcrR family transcriptional regulator [Metabacillus fastidiosus]MED4454725.1 TetR/AcrR family transcriptional regulator [Metabacillus fastidiosus]MED4460862.1 TetR/AcrR family transcriptional regulator [Metabacillus fastidiosus]